MEKKEKEKKEEGIIAKTKSIPGKQPLKHGLSHQVSLAICGSICFLYRAHGFCYYSVHKSHWTMQTRTG